MRREGCVTSRLGVGGRCAAAQREADDSTVRALQKLELTGVETETDPQRLFGVIGQEKTQTNVGRVFSAELE